MRAILTLLLMVLAGCGGGAVECRQRTGSASMTLTSTSGNCGSMPRVLITNVQTTEVAAPCTGTVSYTADNCEMTVDQTCPAGADGSTLRQNGSGTWNEAGTTGTGAFAITVKDSAGAVTCYGTYDATIVKN
jgi:hypothetical protein